MTGLEHADPAWLDEKVSYGDSLERVIQDDGPEHYREHALDLRAVVHRDGRARRAQRATPDRRDRCDRRG